MKQSKLLKKSLAALLAILMVAAMIPMSAFAEEAPAPAEKPAFIESITLGADSEAAQWDPALGEHGGFKVALSGIRVGSTNDAEHIKISWLRTAGQTGTLRISGGATMPAEVVGTNPLDLAKAASGTATSPETGEYTFNLTDGTTTWPLVIDWTRREASTDATIRRVNYRALDNVLGAEVGENTITLTMGFGQTRQLKKGGTDLPTTTADNVLKANKEIFIPNNSGATVQVTTNSANNAALTVKAESGLTKTYTVKYVNETGLTKFEMEGQTANAVIDDAKGEINVKMPYGTQANDEVKVTVDWGENVEKVNGKTAKEFKITLNALSTPEDGKLTADLPIETVKGNATAKYVINVTYPTINTEAKINSIRLNNGSDLGQTINIEDNGQDVQNVTITLPNGTDLTDASKSWVAKVSASAGAKAKINRNADSYTTIAGGSISLTSSAALGKTFTIDVESQDGKAHKYYNFTVATSTTTDENLESVSITDGETTYTGVKKAGENTFEITVPYSKGQGGWTISNATEGTIAPEGSYPLAGWTINAKATAGANVTFTGLDHDEVVAYLNGADGANNVTFTDGQPTANLLFVDASTLVGEMFTQTPGSAMENGTIKVLNSAGAGATWKIVIKKGNPSETGVISSAAFTTATTENDVEDSNTFSAEVATSGNKGTIKATIPYSQKDTASFYFSKLGISENAVAVLISAADTPANTETATINTVFTTGTDITGIAAHGETAGKKVIGAATWAAQVGATPTNPVTLYVFSEKTWGAIKDLEFRKVKDTGDENNEDGVKGYITLDTLKGKATTTYTLTAEYPAAATGAQLLSIESTVDKNVTATYANNEVTITVPSTYETSSAPSSTTMPSDGKVFTLNWKISDKADIKVRNSTNASTEDGGHAWASDEGKENATATKFVVYNGELYFMVSGQSWAKVVDGKTGPNDGSMFTIIAEDKQTRNPIAVNVKVTPAETGAELTSLLVGETAAEADPDNDTTAVKAWKVTLPYGSSLNQPLNITASKMATISVDGVSYDASANDIFDLSDGVTIKVTSEDKKTTNTYKLTVAFGEPSTEADITAAKVGEVEATIAGETITAVVAEDFDFTQAVAVSFEVSEGAKVTKLGEAAPTETYTFTDGEAVAVEVTAQDGKTTKTYQLVVTTKKPSSENTITELTVDGIAATIAEEAITAEAEDPASVTLGIKVSEGATVTVNGKEYTAGDSIDATEPVTIVVTAEDGTEKTYTLTVTKKTEQPKPGLDDVNDVEEGKYFSEAVANMLAKGIMSTNGDKNFRPDGNVPRRDFAIMICKLYGIDTAEYADYENPFVDVKKGDYFYNAVMAAVANDLMVGSGSQFNPGENVSRQQAAVVLAAAQKLEEPTEYKAFNDDAQIASWAKKQVYACRVAGIIAGRSGNVFDPLSPIARKDMAVILNGIEPVEQEPGEPENPDEGNNPENPDEGNNPENPDEGNNPENPDEGNNPENPDEGNNPENPDEGSNPENPDEGNNPENPDEGNTPETPDEGSNPETPDEGSTGGDNTTGGETEAE